MVYFLSYSIICHTAVTDSINIYTVTEPENKIRDKFSHANYKYIYVFTNKITFKNFFK